METKRLYNGITLPDEWPPRDQNPRTLQPMRVPYLESPPPVVPIDLGRQLFVDDFLIEESWMPRVFHRPVKHPGNPVFFPQEEHEKNRVLPPTTIPKCGGIWYDGTERVFKMWYMASYLGAMAYATSPDGLHWERPVLDVVPGTNLILPRDFHPDSGTVWPDPDSADPAQRYKMQIREPNLPNKRGFGARMMASPDGVHWTERAQTGPMGDRSTLFFNPFRNRWCQSIRAWIPPRRRCRLYWEDRDFVRSGAWKENEPVFWTGADCMDPTDEAPAELYNLDAVPYESLMVGFYQILKSPPNRFGEAVGRPKRTELVLATSRDGFHWHRPDRTAFIGACREKGSWEYGYVESTGGILLVVNDELWFYYSAYAGDPTRITEDWRVNGMYANGSVGLAKLRRDGFASLRARFHGASVTTRPLRFSARRLFVNANTAGSRLVVECLDEAGNPLEGFSGAHCIGFSGNATKAEIRWKGDTDLGNLAGRPVRLRFQMDRGDLYAFWVSPSSRGESGGYLAAGGPGLPSARRDTGGVGKEAG